MNAHAQQLMSLMRHPEMYGSFGLPFPPTTLELGVDEDVWAHAVVPALTEAAGPEAQGERAGGLPDRAEGSARAL